jgi:hypothetical protein
MAELVNLSFLLFILSGGTTDYVARKSIYLMQQNMVSRAPKGYRGRNRDRNSHHLKAARCWAKNIPSALPVQNIEELSWKDELSSIQSNSLFIVSSMTYSRPLLQPNTISLLEEIATRFQDELSKRGLPHYRIILTSGTRSIRSQAQLEQVNDSAASESAHWYGYTFDISFGTFVKKHFWSSHVEGDILKDILNQILSEFRSEKKIWVIAERGPSCFHITLRCP